MGELKLTFNGHGFNSYVTVITKGLPYNQMVHSQNLRQKPCRRDWTELQPLSKYHQCDWYEIHDGQSMVTSWTHE